MLAAGLSRRGTRCYTFVVRAQGRTAGALSVGRQDRDSVPLACGTGTREANALVSCGPIAIEVALARGGAARINLSRRDARVTLNIYGPALGSKTTSAPGQRQSRLLPQGCFQTGSAFSRASSFARAHSPFAAVVLVMVHGAGGGADASLMIDDSLMMW